MSQNKIPKYGINAEMLHAGYDAYAPDPGEHESMNCETCGTKMDVERNVEGATSYAESMAGRKHRFDRFVCPNAGMDWHNQCISILKQIRKTPSDSIKKMLKKDLRQLINSKKATKKTFGW